MSPLNRLLGIFLIVALVWPVINMEWVMTDILPHQSDIGKPATTTSAVSDDCTTCRDLPSSIVFTGDVLLARHVERLATKHGDHYPFAGMTDILRPGDVVVANFESTIPSPHSPTPDFTVRFSTPYRLAALLPEYNIKYVSLANNHAFDWGADMYELTQTRLTKSGVTPFGHPTRLDDTSVTYIETKQGVVGLLGIHTLERTPNKDELTYLMAEVDRQSDWQVAYVHWGEEYAPQHNQAQKNFATRLIETGIDVVIGHHPHVVQDIDVIDGVPVFYSLGNFIFDQYFSTSVQEGLAVRLRFADEEISYELIPVTTEFSTAQPRVMSDTYAKSFIDNLLARSSIYVPSQVKLSLQTTDQLATSTQISIMTE